MPNQTGSQAYEQGASMQALLDAGASIHGKTHMDEIAWSLQGENFHYGTPINPACPDRIPGGSSSGSVVSLPPWLPPPPPSSFPRGGLALEFGAMLGCRQTFLYKWLIWNASQDVPARTVGYLKPGELTCLRASLGLTLV